MKSVRAKNFLSLFLAGLLLTISAVLRFDGISFGLPHSFYADEPEIAEPAIKYTYNLKSILRNNDVYKLIPESYVYGTAPVYFYTAATMLFSKTLNSSDISFSKIDIYIFLRIINALISLAVIPLVYIISKRLVPANRYVLLVLSVFFVGLNWKFIVHGHYLNHDIIITLLLAVAWYFFLRYLTRTESSNDPERDTINTILCGILFGLAVSTKITSLLSYPVFTLGFLLNRSYRNAVAFSFVILGTFILTNPFAWLFPTDFLSRILEMQVKEAGLVFDSIDLSPLKYFSSLTYMLTLPVIAAALIGIYSVIKSLRANKTTGPAKFWLLVVIQIVIYTLFFSFQSRKVDRWLLPILPYFMLFAIQGLYVLKNSRLIKAYKSISLTIVALSIVGYLYYPYLLTKQFQPNTPKSQAYIWAQANLPETNLKLAITEEGLDPLNKLPFASVMQFNVYESSGAQYVYPPNPELYDYVLISSRPMQWYKHPIVMKKYPSYYTAWQEFEDQLTDAKKYELVKSFVLAKPNLIPLSDVYVYKRL
ncbi:MAG: hypothetical protein UW65_C0035G0002 [candidate division WWE3 bacterium GW2011_GWB1_44_4]|uniref:Uncharacterized protein n=2 Tax=Katanobacteria TaxID=422282 RepID=A0A0G1KMP2_UNCKA|nr:MAG: hypothetical protein UW65_C0035G0002 [candidate division WWE3 bacterium GW2011_GWB1_44_4]KKT84755.1 MAG: hypothetical protein UW82_C0011G0002 [candidate division WWE3 bacterium GW2011_GWC2_44_9]